MGESSEVGINRLACAMLKQTAYDMAQGGKLSQQTTSEIMRGDVDLHIVLLNLNLSKTEFIEKSKLLYPKKRRLSKGEMEVETKCSELVLR